MPKILHVSMLYPPHVIGGAEKSLQLLAETQFSNGYEVAVACTTPGEFIHENVNGIEVYRMPHETSFWAEDWPQHNAINRFVRKVKMNFNYKLEEHLLHVINEFNPDLVHTHSLTDVSTRVWCAVKQKNIPLIHTLRDYDLLCTNSAMFRDGVACEKQDLKCKIMSCVKFKHHLLVDAVTAVGTEVLNKHIVNGLFHHIPNSRRKVIWNPIKRNNIKIDNLISFNKNVPIRFGYLGRISPEKGVDSLLKAARIIKNMEFEILIAGKITDESLRLSKEAEDLPVKFVGFVNPIDFLAEIDVLVVPSLWPEPFGRTVVESYEMGVPVLGSRAGAIPELIGVDNSDWLFQPGDSVEISKKLALIITNGRSGLPKKSSFQDTLNRTEPERIMNQYGYLYNDLIEHNYVD